MTGNQLSLSTNNGYIMPTTETTSPEMWERTVTTELEFIAMLSGGQIHFIGAHIDKSAYPSLVS